MTEPRLELNGVPLDTTAWDLNEVEGWAPGRRWINTKPIESPLPLTDGDHVTIVLEDGERHEGTIMFREPDNWATFDDGAVSFTFTPDD